MSAQTAFDINGDDWLFYYAKDACVANSMEAAGFWKTDYDALAFRQTPVPSNWAVPG